MTITETYRGRSIDVVYHADPAPMGRTRIYISKSLMDMTRWVEAGMWDDFLARSQYRPGAPCPGSPEFMEALVKLARTYIDRQFPL